MDDKVKEAMGEPVWLWGLKSQTNKSYDIKNELAEMNGATDQMSKISQHYDGYVYDGQVVSGRGAGNILYGRNQATSMFSPEILDIPADIYQWVDNGVYGETSEAKKHYRYGNEIQKTKNDQIINDFLDKNPYLKGIVK